MQAIGTRVKITQGLNKGDVATITAHGAGPRVGWYQLTITGNAHYWVPANCTEPAEPLFNDVSDVFNECGVSVTDVYNESHERVGQIRVRWEQNGTPEHCHFGYEGLAARKVAMYNAMRYAVYHMSFTD